MSILLIMATAGATFLGASETELSPSEVSELGIELTVRDMALQDLHPYPLYMFSIELASFPDCELRGASVMTLNANNEILFQASTDSDTADFDFQIHGDHLERSTLSLHCEGEPDTATGHNFVISLRHYREQQSN